ncbi:hypothetical protein [Chitinophaga tropicalis]|uniref:Uncharacterized protein n=1 Tax=Chitinophaga tropicalis TaxID=2683588 RepID=A0A7K1UCP0_9BACT|nr:hypothetical protein [Chitinophaga tropicalis]MVT12141.1 hypothetical protein [Chitinophaga tropicalis]
MKKLFLLFILLATGVYSHVCQGQASPAATNLTMFGRGLYPGDDATYDTLKRSGFTTIILSSFWIRSNGDVYSGDDNVNPIIHDGKFVGSREWLKRVASLKKSKTSVTRIEFLLEGRWYNQPPNTYDFILDWYNPSKTVSGIATGTGVNSTLYNIAKVLKEELAVDAVCIDDESVYDSESIIQLGKMFGQLDLHMTLCPFRNYDYWKRIITGSEKGLIDAVYVQCYDGGRNNNPGVWAKNLETSIPVYPIFLCRGSFSTCTSADRHNARNPAEILSDMTRFKKDYADLKGGAIWQMADVKSYIKSNCAVEYPESGTATSVTQYLSQLKESLRSVL